MKATGFKGAGFLRHGLIVAIFAMLMGVVASAAPASVSAQSAGGAKDGCYSLFGFVADDETTFAYKWDSDQLYDSSSPDGAISAVFTYDDDGEPKTVVLAASGGYVIMHVAVFGGGSYQTSSYSPDGVSQAGPLSAPENASGGAAGISHVIVCYELVPVEIVYGCSIGFWTQNLLKQGGSAWPISALDKYNETYTYGDAIQLRKGLTYIAQGAAASLNAAAGYGYTYQEDMVCPLDMQ